MTGRRRALLDTSVVIDFPAAAVSKVADEVAVSAVTVAELQFGVTAATDPLTQMHRRRRVQVVLEHFDVLSFDVSTAEYYGASLVRQRERNPRPRRPDLQIAATAARHGLALLTHNGGDFVGLESALAVIDVTGSD